MGLEAPPLPTPPLCKTKCSSVRSVCAELSRCSLSENGMQVRWPPSAPLGCPPLGLVVTLFCSSSSQYDQVSHSWSTGLRVKAAWRFPTIKPWSALSVSELLSSFLLIWEEPPFFGHPTYVPCPLAHFLSMPASLKTGAAPWECSCRGASPELPHWVGQGINSDTVQWLGLWPPLTVGTSVCSGQLCCPCTQGWVPLHWCTHQLQSPWFWKPLGSGD